MATAGFLGGLGAGVERQAEEKQLEARQDKTLLRERQANDLEKAIGEIDADPNISPEDKAKQRAAIRQQLTGLYQPHEGPHLLGRLLRLDKKQAGPMSESLGLPTDGSVQPFDWSKRHSVDEVLAQIQGGPGKPQKKPIGQLIKGSDGNWYQGYEQSDGSIKYEVESQFKPEENAASAKVDFYAKDKDGNVVPMQIVNGKGVPIALPEGMTASEKPSGKPEETLKYDKDTGEITDTRSGKRWSDG